MSSRSEIATFAVELREGGVCFRRGHDPSGGDVDGAARILIARGWVDHAGGAPLCEMAALGLPQLRLPLPGEADGYEPGHLADEAAGNGRHLDRKTSMNNGHTAPHMKRIRPWSTFNGTPLTPLPDVQVTITLSLPPNRLVPTSTAPSVLCSRFEQLCGCDLGAYSALRPGPPPSF